MFLKFVSFLYGLGVSAKLLLYKSGLKKAQKFEGTVISVGNISAGGTGKTPLAAKLCRMAGENSHPAMITRGYGGAVSGPEKVDASAGPEKYGDEALMAAKMLGEIPVVISKNRAEGIRFAKNKLGCSVFVLDDAYQNFSIFKNAEIALIDALAPWAGLQREPKKSLKRADLIIISRSNLADVSSLEALEKELSSISGKPVMREGLSITGIRKLSDGGPADRDSFKKRKTSALCAVGNPVSFEKLLKAEGIEPAHFLTFRDHHVFTEKEIGALDTDTPWLVTEKDEVKLKKFSKLRDFYAVETQIILYDDSIKNFILPPNA